MPRKYPGLRYTDRLAAALEQYFRDYDRVVTNIFVSGPLFAKMLGEASIRQPAPAGISGFLLRKDAVACTVRMASDTQIPGYDDEGFSILSSEDLDEIFSDPEILQSTLEFRVPEEVKCKCAIPNKKYYTGLNKQILYCDNCGKDIAVVTAEA